MVVCVLLMVVSIFSWSFGSYLIDDTARHKNEQVSLVIDKSYVLQVSLNTGGSDCCRMLLG